MYKQVLDPVSHSLGVTSIFAILPLLVLFVLLGGVRMKAQWASLAALAVAIIVALAVYSMPAGQTFALLVTFVGIGIIVNVLIIYIVAQVLGERERNRERREGHT